MKVTSKEISTQRNENLLVLIQFDNQTNCYSIPLSLCQFFFYSYEFPPIFEFHKMANGLVLSFPTIDKTHM